MISYNRSTKHSNLKIAIGLCGKIYSGKDTAADLFVKKYGYKKYSYSYDVLRKIIQAAHGIESREVYINLGLSLEKTFGRYSLDRLLIGKILKDNCPKVVIPNIRLLSNIEYWKNKTGYRFYLIGISANEELRFDRWKNATGKNKSHTYDSHIKTKSDFLDLSSKDFEETDLKKIFSTNCFDFKIENNLRLSDLQIQIDKIKKKIENID